MGLGHCDVRLGGGRGVFVLTTEVGNGGGGGGLCDVPFMWRVGYGLCDVPFRCMETREWDMGFVMSRLGIWRVGEGLCDVHLGEGWGKGFVMSPLGGEWGMGFVLFV